MLERGVVVSYETIRRWCTKFGQAAKRFFRKLLKGLRYVPRVIITDKLASYQAAHREMLASVEHRRSKHLNNRSETRINLQGSGNMR